MRNRSQESGAGSRTFQANSTNSTLASEIPDRDERSGFHRANKPSVRATFFVLGWIAKRMPGLVREISSRGHEVASHGFDHDLCNNITETALKKDLIKSKSLLEDITGEAILGYRAPSFSVDNATLALIEAAGYRYDSSYNAFGLHGRYGKLSTNGFRRQGIAYRISENFYEIPISNLFVKPIAHRRKPIALPFSGGGYFRLLPNALFNRGVRSILKKHNSYVFYIHPWEVDPEQPRVHEAPRSFKFRHYINLHKTEGKLKNMIRRFRHCRFVGCGEYLSMERRAWSEEWKIGSGEER